MGEYLNLFGSDSVKAVYNVTRSLRQQVALNAIEHFVKAKGYSPLFLFINVRKSKSKVVCSKRPKCREESSDRSGFAPYSLVGHSTRFRLLRVWTAELQLAAPWVQPLNKKCYDSGNIVILLTL